MQQHKQDLLTSQQCPISVPSLRPIASYLSGLWLYILVLTRHHSPEHRRRILSPRGCWEQVSSRSGALFVGRFMFSWGHFLRVKKRVKRQNSGPNPQNMDEKRLPPSRTYQSHATGFIKFPSWTLNPWPDWDCCLLHIGVLNNFLYPSEHLFPWLLVQK